MHRFRSWTLDPPEWRTQRNRALSIEGGDGSALDVDFTTGVLDPTVSFSRTGNATFINSSGNVEWAAANMFANSAWNDATATPSGWTAFGLSATATVAIAADPEARTIAVTTGAGGQPFLYIAPTVSQGVVYTASVEIVSVTHGSGVTEEVQYNQVLAPPFASTFAYYMNGSSVGATAKVTQTGVLTCVYVAASSSQIRIGFASSPRNNCSVTVKAPQHQPGEAITRTSFFRRTAAEGAYYAPRFDYDPNTLQPNGLLVEGSMANLIEQSQYCWGAGSVNTWLRSAQVHVNAVNGTAGASAVSRITGPDNVSLSGTSLFKEAASNYVRINQNFASVISSTYTVSVWVRHTTSNNTGFLLGLFNGGTWLSATGSCSDPSVHVIGSASAGVEFRNLPTNKWVRCSITATATSTTTLFGIYPKVDTNDAATVYVWGSQAELGNGSSSYIPTGASTATRAFDNVDFADKNWFTSWTSTWITDVKIGHCSVAPYLLYIRSTTDPFNNHLNISCNNNNSLTALISRSTSNAVQQWTTNNPVLSSSEFNKIAWVVADTAKLYHGGLSPFTSSAGRAVPLGNALSAVQVANNPTTGTSYSVWFKSLKYYPKALTNIELENLTKPVNVNESFNVSFTSTTLDSRLTHSRACNATFINNLGLVEWASVNLLGYSDFSSSAFPWSPFTAISGTNTVSVVNKTLTSTVGSGGDRAFYRQTINTIEGQYYSCAVRVTAVTGSVIINNFIQVSNLVLPALFYKDGVLIDGTITPVTTGVYTLVFKSNNTTSELRLGVNTIGALTTNASITMTEPRIVNGFKVLPEYILNSALTAFYAPRYDYSPTTIGEEKGLLIEGENTNIARYNLTLETTGGYWAYNNCGRNVDSAALAPDGVAGVTYGVASATTASAIYYSFSGAVTTVPYTYSVWVRGRSVTSAIFAIFTPTVQAVTARVISGPGTFDASTTFPRITGLSTTAWTRISITTTANLAAASGIVYNYINATTGSINDSIELWGAQFERGSAATSMIPTGSSTVTRVADTITMSDISSLNWNNSAGSLYLNMGSVSETNTAFVSLFPAPIGFYRSGLNRVLRVILNNSAGTSPRIGVDTNNSTPSFMISNIFTTRPTSTIFKFATSHYNTGNVVSFVVNGGTPAIGTSGTSFSTMPTPERLLIHQDNSSNAFELFPLHLKQIKYWPSALTPLQLKYITGT